jgi:uncharacterized membrane protein YkvA (DUF1232 family)
MTMANDINGSNGKANQRGNREEEQVKEYLEDAAGRVTERDIEELNTSVPKKLKRIDMSGLNDGLQWVQSLVDKASTLFDMMRDRGFTMGGKSRTLIAAGLIYLVLPFDLAPDFIPGLGFIDDAFVLSTLWKIIESEVERYQAYRRGLGEG